MPDNDVALDEGAVAAARALVAKADAAAAASADEAKKQRAEQLAPLRDFAASDPFGSVLMTALTRQPDFASDPAIGPHLVAIIVGMKNLQAAVA